MYCRLLFLMSIFLGSCSDGQSSFEGQQLPKDQQADFDLKGVKQCPDVERAGNADACDSFRPVGGSCELSRLPQAKHLKSDC
jgi:hypothetical protein